MKDILPSPVLIGAVVLSLIVVLLLMTTCFIFFPAFALHCSFFILPIALALLSFLSLNPVAIILAIISMGIDLFLYFWIYRRRIRYSAAVLKETTRILIRHLPMLTAIASVLVGTSLILWVLVAGALYGDKQPEIIATIAVLYFYWHFFSVSYTYRVLCSSIVALEVFGPTLTGVTSILFESLRNTAYCLGSISFAALLVAIVATLKHLVNRRDSNEENRNIFMEILRIIAHILLSILQDILDFVNEWVFVYMALYGGSYKRSIKDAYDELINNPNSILVDSLAMKPLLGLLGIGGLIIYVIVLYFSLTIKDIDLETISPIIFASLLYILIMQLFIVIFDAGAKAFLFAYNRDSKAVKTKYPETYEILNDTKNTL